MSETKIIKIHDLINEIDHCIKHKKPFSYIRWGDGGIKMIHAIMTNDKSQIKEIAHKEGIPENKFMDVMKAWAFFSRKANYIDSPQVYYDGFFWERCRKKFKPMSKKTDKRLRMWRELYNYAEFDNENYCNPEVNFLLCLRLGNKRNILNIMKDRKIAFITACKDIPNKLSKYDVTLIPIVSQYENHYEACYKNTIKIIERDVKKYDLFFVSAGELGRIYTGLIKHYGGIALDMGFIAEYWSKGDLPDRLLMFMKKNPNNELEFKLTDEGNKYKDFI